MSEPRSVLVITGAAATGKSTIGDHLRGRDGLVVLDGDVLGRGAAATAYGRRDYVGFWRFALALSEPSTVRRRIAARTGTSGVPSPEAHVELDRQLRKVASVPAPHTWTTHDVTSGDVRSTVAAGAAWAAHVRR